MNHIHKSKASNRVESKMKIHDAYYDDDDDSGGGNNDDGMYLLSLTNIKFVSYYISYTLCNNSTRLTCVSTCNVYVHASMDPQWTAI